MQKNVEITEALMRVADSLVAYSTVDTRWIDPGTNTLHVVIDGERFVLTLTPLVEEV